MKALKENFRWENIKHCRTFQKRVFQNYNLIQSVFGWEKIQGGIVKVNKIYTFVLPYKMLPNVTANRYPVRPQVFNSGLFQDLGACAFAEPDLF